jgi:hypothetical protein
MRLAARLLGFVLLAFLVITPPIAGKVYAEELKVPSWVYTHCSRYFTMEVNAAGTILIFWRQDDPTKVCAVVTSARDSTRHFFEKMQLHLSPFKCWQVTFAYEAIVPGANPALIVVFECEKEKRRVRVIFGYQDGVLFGYITEW